MQVRLAGRGLLPWVHSGEARFGERMHHANGRQPVGAGNCVTSCLYWSKTLLSLLTWCFMLTAGTR
jgi:hypothetical protein